MRERNNAPCSYLKALRKSQSIVEGAVVPSGPDSCGYKLQGSPSWPLQIALSHSNNRSIIMRKAARKAR